MVHDKYDIQKIAFFVSDYMYYKYVVLIIEEESYFRKVFYYTDVKKTRKYIRKYTPLFVVPHFVVHELLNPLLLCLKHRLLLEVKFYSAYHALGQTSK